MKHSDGKLNSCMQLERGVAQGKEVLYSFNFNLHKVQLPGNVGEVAVVMAPSM